MTGGINKPDFRTQIGEGDGRHRRRWLCHAEKTTPAGRGVPRQATIYWLLSTRDAYQVRPDQCWRGGAQSWATAVPTCFTIFKRASKP